MPNSYSKGGNIQHFAKQILASKGGYVHNQMTQPMLATGGPIYGDPASEYVYAMGGMYGDPYARGGQIDYTNDMYSSYAGGGPMPSNLPQAFDGPAAQNKSGMYIYPDGGMMSPEEQMMQEQMMQQQAPQEQMQQQGGQEQMMQMVQQIAQAIMQGENPEKIMSELEGSGMPPEQVQQIMQAAMQMASQQQQQQPMQDQQQMIPQQGMMARGGKMRYDGGGTFNFTQNPNYLIPGSNSYSTDESASWEDETELPTVGTATTPNGLGMNFKSAPQMANQVTALSKLAANNASNAGQAGDTPWFEEPWWSKASRPIQAIPGLLAAGIAARNKKHLTADQVTPPQVSLLTQRIVNAENSRNALDAGLRMQRDTAANAGMLSGNTTNAILNANKALAATNNLSFMDEEKINAGLRGQYDLNNVAARNQFKLQNRAFDENRKTQMVAGIQDATSKLASTAQEERKQNLQEWIAQNRLGTRSYRTNINGQDVFVSADGQIYDAKTGKLLSAG
jgi:hypothetical protein